MRRDSERSAKKIKLTLFTALSYQNFNASLFRYELMRSHKLFPAYIETVFPKVYIVFTTARKNQQKKKLFSVILPKIFCSTVIKKGERERQFSFVSYSMTYKRVQNIYLLGKFVAFYNFSSRSFSSLQYTRQTKSKDQKYPFFD